MHKLLNENQNIATLNKWNDRSQKHETSMHITQPISWQNINTSAENSIIRFESEETWQLWINIVFCEYKLDLDKNQVEQAYSSHFDETIESVNSDVTVWISDAIFNELPVASDIRYRVKSMLQMTVKLSSRHN